MPGIALDVVMAAGKPGWRMTSLAKGSKPRCFAALESAQLAPCNVSTMTPLSSMGTVHLSIEVHLQSEILRVRRQNVGVAYLRCKSAITVLL